MCSNKGREVNKCNAPRFSVQELRSAFVKMFNTLKTNSKVLLDETINEKSAVLREQLQNAREKVAVRPNISEEMADIQKMLEDEEMRFSEYDETIARRLIELIRVEADNKMVIYLKGGIRVEEYVR